ncbi:MAG: radical SAM peptide maturase [Porphyromonadaceae bacterium]|nr:radical SAM peptide maturase [Porphyromonadaceae bacterium]
MDIYKKYKYTLNITPSMVKYSLLNSRQLIFEVTSRCNLQCEYCGYGELHNTRRVNPSKNMTFSLAKSIIDYLVPFWYEESLKQDYPKMFIGFYGGEPLMNFKLIQQTIDYIDNISPKPKRNICYTMTTNATLLKKHMSYLVENKFKLLISIDGDEIAHSYRVHKNGGNSYSLVIKNIDLLRNNYPEYFENNVSFNSVLTNRSDYIRTKKFISDNFGKTPQISEVSDIGVLPEKMEMFKQIYRSGRNDLLEDKSNFSEQSIHESPDIRQLYRIIKLLSNNSYDSYKSLLAKQQQSIIPTGTCFPFDRKIYLTVDGGILPCERIHQKYLLGTVTANKVNIDFDKIAAYYSTLYKKVWRNQCHSCYMRPICDQCMFHIDNLETKTNCKRFKSKDDYDTYIQYYMNLLAENSDVYEKMMQEFY